MHQLEFDTNDPKTSSTENAPTRKPRGFAAMDRAKVREIASKGGIAAQAAGTAHRFTAEEARAAGKKGGIAPHVRRGAAKGKLSVFRTPTCPGPWLQLPVVGSL